MAKNKKQLRLSENKVLAGVIGGLSEYLGFDMTLMRIVYAVFIIATGFFPGVVMYLAAWIIMKAADEQNNVIDVTAKKKK